MQAQAQIRGAPRARVQRSRCCRCRAALDADTAPPAAAQVAHGMPAQPVRRPVKLQITQSRAKPTRSLGQHFLQDLSVVDDAVSAAGLAPGDRVLEVGPGTGVLTRALLAAGAHVTAVEKDAALATALRDNNAAVVASGALDVVHDDALRWLRGAGAVAALAPASAASHTPPGRRARVVANIPFGISTDLLALLLPRGEAVASVTLLVQEEWAQRLVVAPRSGDGSDAREMSIRVAFYAPQCRYVRHVPRTCFAPPPHVDCAVVRFDLLSPAHWPLPPSHAAPFFAMVRSAFNARRKMLRNTLPGCEHHLRDLGLPADVRPQQVDLHSYVALYKAMRMRASEPDSSCVE